VLAPADQPALGDTRSRSAHDGGDRQRGNHSSGDSNGEDQLVRALTAIVGAGAVLTDPDVKLSYERDVTGRYSGSARIVVLPADTGECAAVLAECSRAGVPVLAQGGNTGLVGGGVPRAEEVVLSTRRMTTLEQLDGFAGQITVDAGVTLADAQAAAKRGGFELTIDHGARSSATIGGMAATDAGGSLALRYGTMRRQIVGIEGVLADGRIVSRMSGLLKDNAGYRWQELLVGSEGTLAVITRVRLALAELQPRGVTALFGASSFVDALSLLRALRAHAPSMRAADFFTAAGVELVCGHRRLPPPLASAPPVYVIVDCVGRDDLVEQLAVAARASEEEFGERDRSRTERDVVVAQDSAAAARLWDYRDAQNEAIRAAGVAHKLDVSIPLAQLAWFVRALEGLLASQRPEARLVLYGHLGDGNVHVNLLGLRDADLGIDEAVLQLAALHGGTISAEHGVGVAKARWLGLVRSAEEIELMRSIKQAFDPDGILAPGRILPHGPIPTTEIVPQSNKSL
jgi:FAD/FMN-containing dehydrogenase